MRSAPVMRNGNVSPPIGIRPEGWTHGVWFDNRAGDSHPASKITGAAARWVVRCHAAGVDAHELAAMLGVHRSTIQGIIRGIRYGADTLEVRKAVKKS